jgi:dTDP-4-amino-4,6-dideoxy-D-glucose acyltransferase
MSFYSRQELEGLGFASLGDDVKISRKASIYGANRIHLGSHVRVDDYCVISAGDGGIDIGSYVHIAVYCSLMGGEKITLCDFSGLSSRVSIYSSNDDYSGEFLTNPTVPGLYTGVKCSPVLLSRHVIVGAGCVILPGVTLEEGVAIGSLSLVTKSCNSFGIYSGVPARRIAERKRSLLELEAKLRL